MVADRESDSIDVFRNAVATGPDDLIRAAWDRRLVEAAGRAGADGIRRPPRTILESERGRPKNRIRLPLRRRIVFRKEEPTPGRGVF